MDEPESAAESAAPPDAGSGTGLLRGLSLLWPLGDGLPGLSEVGVKEFYVHDASLAERGLTAADLTVDAVVVDAARINGVLAGCSAVLPF